MTSTITMTAETTSATLSSQRRLRQDLTRPQNTAQ